MATGWMVSDSLLFQELRAYLASIRNYPAWQIDLYVNDQSPGPTDDSGDYELPTWAGYATQNLVLANWGAVQVIANVAQTVYGSAISWELPESLTETTVFGYLVTDVSRGLLWAEAFYPEVAAVPGGTIRLQPQYKHGVLAPPVAAFGAKKRGRPRQYPLP